MGWRGNFLGFEDISEIYSSNKVGLLRFEERNCFLSIFNCWDTLAVMNNNSQKFKFWFKVKILNDQGSKNFLMEKGFYSDKNT